MSNPIRDGMRASAPYQLGVTLFGLISGAIMAEAGLSFFETLAMTVLVLAGAAQLAAVQMLAEGTSILVIVASCICINLRFGMYSAAIAPYLTGMPGATRRWAAYLVHDQSFAVSMARFQTREEDWRDRLAFFTAAGGVTTVVWQGTTVLGHVIGARAPETWPIDFAMPVVFTAMTVPFLTSRPRWLAAVVAGGSALVLRDMPLDLGLLVATGLGICAGLLAGEGAPRD